MARYALTIFLSAFLLFQVQPLIAKYILPWFGGSPAVWTTCMLFFQVVLLAGYAYAHFISEKLSARSQTLTHLGLLALSLVFLPIIPDAQWKPSGEEAPTLRILLLLGVTIGVPYLLLSTTGPLLQRWFSLTHPGRSPYRLFALSNFGSLLALISYPLLFEPTLKLGTQAVSWSVAYAVFAAMCGLCAWLAWRSNSALSREKPSDSELPSQAVADSKETIAEVPTSTGPSRYDIFMWLGLSALPSIMLLATTNQMCQEVAVVPFLWVLPLSLYLISFIICFDSERWYNRRLFGVLLVGSSIWVCICLFEGLSVPFLWQLAAYSTALFACCMTCHGELAKSKPEVRHLTLFYLVVSLGGALGGVFVVVIAPIIFMHYWEFHVGLAGAVIITMLAYQRAAYKDFDRKKARWIWGIVIPVPTLLVIALVMHVNDRNEDVLHQTRNFYGVLTVTENEDSLGKYYSLRHGRIQHGFQYRDPELRQIITSYYGAESGIGVAIRFHPDRNEDSPMKIGVIGLGTGTLAAYGEPGDSIRIYEINPDVKQIAREFFTFWDDSAADVEVVLGDARVQLERELKNSNPQRFDVLAVDAFSSDSIPMHLLTRECFKVYQQHLDDDGILAVHISNRYLDLSEVVRSLADELDYTSLMVDWNNPDDDPSVSGSTWILVTQSKDFINSPDVNSAIREWPHPKLIWTDDYGSLRHVLK